MDTTFPYKTTTIRNARPGELFLDFASIPGVLIRAAEDPEIPDLEVVSIQPDSHLVDVWSIRKQPPNRTLGLSIGNTWGIHIEPSRWTKNIGSRFKAGMIGLAEDGLYLFCLSNTNSDPCYLSLSDFLVTGTYPAATYIAENWVLGFRLDGELQPIVSFECEDDARR